LEKITRSLAGFCGSLRSNLNLWKNKTVVISAAEREDVNRFVEYYLNQAGQLVPQVGYITLPGDAYERALDKFKKRTIGSIFAGGSQVGITVDTILDAR